MIQEDKIEEPISLSMSPYFGQWTKIEAAHLLRRCMFGPTFKQIEDAVTNGLDHTMVTLLTLPVLGQPLSYDPGEGVAPQGTTWVNMVYPPGDTNPTETARVRSLAAWTMERLNVTAVTISEKMSLFWQNHFAAKQATDSRATYNYFMILHSNCLGNYKEMVKAITIDPCMLQFLNGSSNTVFSPNENFSRELLELYTVGKGPQIGPGDYTNYTEDDIAAGAKIMTGWTIKGYRSNTDTSPYSEYDDVRHDKTSKKLSAHFGNVTVVNAGNNEYNNYLDVIFKQSACATFICKKLYRYFVNYDLTAEVEQTVIPVMAQTLLSNNYAIMPVVEGLLKSEHFFDLALKGTLIKSPLEEMFSWLNTSESHPNYDIVTNYTMYLNVYWYTSAQGQAYLNPPSVGGWPAYYQAPSYSKLWLNSTYLKQRFDIISWFTIYKGINVDGNFYKVNALNVVNGLSIPNNPVQVIQDLIDIYSPNDLELADKEALKAILTNGLPDFEWTDQYNEYQADSGNATVSDPVRIRVEFVLNKLFKMPHAHTV
jgi:uncharacterized protein (DUF1800 family)